MQEEREQAITDMIDLIHQADQKVQDIATKKRQQRSKVRRGRMRRALRRALKK